MKEKNLAANSCRLQMNGIRFFSRNVLNRPAYKLFLHYPKRPLRIPDLLTRNEARRLVNVPENLKYCTQLQVFYGCGLRVSEVVALRVKDIDSERGQLKVEQGKGAKDRFVPLSSLLINQLRNYWHHYRPLDKLFYFNSSFNRATGVSALQRVYNQSKKINIAKNGGIHALRHAFASHQLEKGVPIHILQRWLGHKDIHTTMRYVHWVPSYQSGLSYFNDLLDEETGHDIN